MPAISAVLSLLGSLGLDVAAIAVSLLLAYLSRSWLMVMVQAVHLAIVTRSAWRDREGDK